MTLGVLCTVSVECGILFMLDILLNVDRAGPGVSPASPGARATPPPGATPQEKKNFILYIKKKKKNFILYKKKKKKKIIHIHRGKKKKNYS
jgi:hypothetical protein